MDNSTSIEALDIHVQGVVQGVGFRPFVYRCAHELHLTGWVLNALDGVSIHAEGTPDALDTFALKLAQEAPEAAQVKEISLHEAPVEGFAAFEIRYSDAQETQEVTLVSPDLATCDACVEELFNPQDRRYHYPFINCTNCGPRFTIINNLPYDRAQTSMIEFKMDAACEEEYNNPLNRRFHAQPNACFTCGPKLGWINAEDMEASQVKKLTGEDAQWAASREESDAIIDACVNALKAGKIVAVKGLGGYHLVCDAQNAEALANLRKRKHRYGKAFAVMAQDVKQARLFAEVGQAEAAQLESSARPIVLLRKKVEVQLSAGLADSLPELGIMLPATPVQHLLSRAFGGLLVMTSGNIHNEPIVTTETEAFSQLAGIADAFLVNNREIVERFDDSVVRVLNPAGGEAIVQVVRRARGMAPAPIKLPPSVNEDGQLAPQLLAVGPELKNTFTFTRDTNAFTSQHLGDMENVSAYDNWLETKSLYQKLFHLQPQKLACDHHPEYLLSKWARKTAEEQGIELVEVQHHHAHVVAVMAENQLEGPVCGFAFDGTGYGMDGAIWGGEVLLCNLQTFERFANVAYFPLPGATQAIHHTDRCAYGALWEFDLLDHPYAQKYFAGREEETQLMNGMIESGLNSPYTSSMGRLFDTASALLGICTTPRYEGEAAILLEAELYKEPSPEYEPDARYQFGLLKNTATEQSTAQDTSVLLLDPAPVFEAILDDLEAGVSTARISRNFHEAVLGAILTIAEAVRSLYGIEIVTLSGGVFMNRYLITRAVCELQNAGFTVALNQDLPPNDASVSFGQAVIALHSS